MGHRVGALSSSETGSPSNRRWTAHLATLALAFAPLAAMLPAEAQQAGMVYRVGLMAETPPRTPELRRLTDALVQGLRDHGFVEGQNLVIERRYSEGNEARNAEFAAELVRTKVDLILAANSSAAHAAKQATSTIPIVMLNVGNPERQGLVASLAQPGGNITGMSNQLGGEVSGKMFQLLTKQRLPVVAQARFWADAGGLMTYGPDSAALFRRGASYAARILRGTKPADLPVEQPTKFEFVLNMKTAKALGLRIPQALLLQADQILE